ncbi:hypothetical protein [Pontivivens ytuae]|uniref:Uncharacterized protein n=1 Tax=Pontivivens ytuae TaxID=2789856 RepID=A0A7S9LUF7_9RHOB|nr:hypothetical protein [Pontivivens ytuae]QPH55210.1 hypothetical protein I0K15_05575 [Pontivivens ytuae]
MSRRPSPWDRPTERIMLWVFGILVLGPMLILLLILVAVSWDDGDMFAMGLLLAPLGIGAIWHGVRGLAGLPPQSLHSRIRQFFRENQSPYDESVYADYQAPEPKEDHAR